MKILNLCSGSSPSTQEGVINVDADKTCKPDVLLNIISGKWPWKDNEIDEVWMFHAMEHLKRDTHGIVLLRINNALKMGGRAIFSYPEFKRCAYNFVENFRGQRGYWEQTLYGRQDSPFDFHVVPMHSPYFKSLLLDYGFGEVEFYEESTKRPFNTIMKGIKVVHSFTREDVVAEEVFNVSLQDCPI